MGRNLGLNPDETLDEDQGLVHSQGGLAGGAESNSQEKKHGVWCRLKGVCLVLRQDAFY